ncbi:hypothetical protein ACO0QE_003241 [Hanseniaspora vineae]
MNDKQPISIKEELSPSVKLPNTQQNNILHAQTTGDKSISEDQDVEKKSKKRMACTNCRKRRKKCDFQFPCSSCVKLSLDCNINVNDLRKKRYKNKYVEELESKVQFLERKLQEAQSLRSSSFANSASPASSSSYNIISPSNSNGLLQETRNSPLYQNTYEQKQLKPQTSTSSLPALSNSALKKSSSRINDLKTTVIIRPDSFLSSEGFQNNKESSVPLGLDQGQTCSKDIKLQPIIPSLSTLQAKVALTNGSTNNGSDNTGTAPIPNHSVQLPHLPFHATKPAHLSNDSQILQSLKLFFQWLYPGYFIFVHRESFLYGFFTDYQDGYEHSRYCSSELVYAVAAVGSRLSPELRSKSAEYFETARLEVLNKIFQQSYTAEITTVQTLMCLAFYELGNGNFSSAWYFSGLAIRIGYDIGFQLDPQAWVVESSGKSGVEDDNLGNKSNQSGMGHSSEDDFNDSDKLTRSEMAIRSRIYWGCYVADHYICLILGRAPSLSVSNSTIPDSDEMPEIAGTEDFKFESKLILQVSLPLKNLIILSRIVQIFTSKLFIEPNISKLEKLEYLRKFNSKVYSWRQSLPNFLKWSKNTLENNLDYSTDPTICYFWYHYYIVLLTFNKPFIGDSEVSQVAVKEVLDDLKMLFTNFKLKMGKDCLNKCSLNQLFSCSLAIQILVKLKSITANEAETQPSGSKEKELEFRKKLKNIEQSLKFFSDMFELMSPTYDIPGKMMGGTLSRNTKGNTYLLRSKDSLSVIKKSSSSVPPSFNGTTSVSMGLSPGGSGFLQDYAHPPSPFGMTEKLQFATSNSNHPSPQPPQLSFFKTNNLSMKKHFFTSGHPMPNGQNHLHSLSPQPGLQHPQHQQPLSQLQQTQTQTQTQTQSHSINSYPPSSSQPSASVVIGMNVNNQYVNNVNDLNNMISYHHAMKRYDLGNTAPVSAATTNNVHEQNSTHTSSKDILVPSLEHPDFDPTTAITPTNTTKDVVSTTMNNPVNNSLGDTTTDTNIHKMALPTLNMPVMSTFKTTTPNNKNSGLSETTLLSNTNSAGLSSTIPNNHIPQSNNNINALFINNNNIEYTYDFSLSDEIDGIIRETFGIDNFNTHHTL